MRDFARLLEKLEKTDRQDSKVLALQHYLRHAEKEDVLWAFTLLLQKEQYLLTDTDTLSRWAMEYTRTPASLFFYATDITFDARETIALLTQDPERTVTAISLARLAKELSGLKGLDQVSIKNYVLSCWAYMDYEQALLFNKLISGGIQPGISSRILAKALSGVSGLEEPTLYDRLCSNWHPDIISLQELLAGKNTDTILAKAYPFPQPVMVTDVPAFDPDQYAWLNQPAGIEIQLIVRNGQLYFHTRTGSSFTGRFPELQSLVHILPDHTVLLGSLIAQAGAENILEQHLLYNKSTATGLLHFAATDLPEDSQENQCRFPYSQRRASLEQIVDRADHPLLILAPLLSGKPATAATPVIIQDRKAMYGKGSFLLPSDQPALYLVLIQATSGTGRRTEFYSDYTFGAWLDGQLVPVCKTKTGIQSRYVAEINDFIRKNTLRQFGAVRSVQPLLVCEIGFKNIERSDKNRYGISFSQPYFIKTGRTIPVTEAAHVKDLLLLAGQPPN